MSERDKGQVYWIQYQSKPILVANCAYCNVEQILAAVDRLEQELIQSRGGRVLFDATESSISPVIRERMIQMQKNLLRANLRPTAVAIVGVSGWRTSLVKIITAFSGLRPEFFDTMDEALTWLAKH